MRQVNNNAPEVLVRQVLPDSTNLPFFRYYMLRPPAANQMPQLMLVPAAELPLKHTFATHGDGADSTRIDSLRAVLVSYVITNGQTGALERKQRISFNVPLPNMGMKQLKICGSEPILGTGLTAVWCRQPLTRQGQAHLEPGVRRELRREGRGPLRHLAEEDHRRRLARPADLGRGGPGELHLLDDNSGAACRAATYEYRLAAQDCSPKLSTPVSLTAVTIP